MTESQKTLFPLLAVAASAASMAYVFFSAVVWTDDALIYFRVANNITQGIGPVINAGDSHSARHGLP